MVQIKLPSQTQSNPVEYPVIPLRDLVIFPDMIVPLFVGRERSVRALEYSTAQTSGRVLLVTQRNATDDNPGSSGLYKIGVISKVLQISKMQEPTTKVFIQGEERVKIVKFSKGETWLAQIESLADESFDENSKEIISLQRSIIDRFEEYINMNKKINPEVLAGLKSKKASDFCNTIGCHLNISVEKKQKILATTSMIKKLERVLLYIDEETEMMLAENKVKARVRVQLEKNQKDYYLNEQLKAIHKELGEDDYKEESVEIGKKIKKLKLSTEAREKAEAELKKLKMMSPMSSEAAITRNYLDWLTELPWQEYSATVKDLTSAESVLNADHYGLEKIKERVIEYLAVNMRTQELKSPILCFIGPPGVGKTSLAESIARATGRVFAKISLGGLRDEAEIRGHRRTYIGAMPGKIIQAMKKAKTSNPVILLDEIDKLSYDHRGDPASALLEVLDPKQNSSFNDHYLEVDYDLSKVMFIATANTHNLPRPLLDRLEIIKLSGYTEDEKMRIAEDYLISKQQSAHALKEEEVSITKDAVLAIIRYYTREAGVRQLDRDIATIMRKSVKKILMDQGATILVNDSNIKDFLGVRKFILDEIAKKNKVGVANGLAYTDFGGEILELESVALHGKGEIKITGKLGEVMRESVQAAIGFIRSHAAEFGIAHNVFKEKDIHIHVPAGATPKDGPSAGVGMCISIVSALTGIPVKRDVAVTGEITLNGRVLAIGGLKEKLLSALRSGVKTVLIPAENVKDLEEIPQKVKDNLEIIPIENAEEALSIALESTLMPLNQTLGHSPTPSEIAPQAH